MGCLPGHNFAGELVAFICGEGITTPTEKCFYCWRGASHLCDGQPAPCSQCGRRERATCDRPLCPMHATTNEDAETGADIDYCPDCVKVTEHFHQWKDIKALADVLPDLGDMAPRYVAACGCGALKSR